jgi:hypothetical protein
MVTGIKKNRFCDELGANLPRQVKLSVVRAIVDQVDPILGVASARYEKYAEMAATGVRTVERTIVALHRLGRLRKRARHDGPPVLWLPEIMNMKADEAVRRARRLARRAAAKTTNAAEPSLDAGMQVELRDQGRAKAKTPAHANDQEILRLIHTEWDARGLTPNDPQALTKAIHGTRKSRPVALKHMDQRAVRKAYQRARARLPGGYDGWIDLVEKWDKSYNHQQARGLVDRLITAVGKRPRGIVDKLFAHLEQQICDHWPKKVRRLECECERLEKDEFYIPQLRPLMRDGFSDQVYAVLADGPKTKDELKRLFGKTYGAISSVGLRLRNAGQIQTIWQGDQWTWVRAGAAPVFVPARDAIVAALKKGPMTVPALAQETGKGKSTVKSALHRHLVPNGEVIRTQLGTFALTGTAPSYISKCDAIVAALKKGPMTVPMLAQETYTTPSSLYQFIDLLRVKGKVICTKRGVYALTGRAPVYIATSDAIISVLAKKKMKRGLVVQQVNKLTKSTRSASSIGSVLARLTEQGTVNQDEWGGEYRLARRARTSRGACSGPPEERAAARRKVARRRIAARGLHL